MDFTELLDELNNASLYELFRINVVIRNILDDPERIKSLRNGFAVGDAVTYFEARENALVKAVVLEKNPKYVVVKNLNDNSVWSIRYCMLNLEGKDSDIRTRGREKLTKNHLKVGDFLGFDHEGKQICGVVVRLNPKSVTLVTPANKQWRVSYGLLFRVLEGESVIVESEKFLIVEKNENVNN